MSNGPLPIVMRKASELSVVWPNAQRTLDKMRAQLIANRFDWNLFEPIAIMKCNGHIADGDHRHSAAVIRFGPDVMLPCYEHDGGEMEAAKLFVHLNLGRKQPVSMDVFKTSVEGKMSPQWEIDQIIKRNGYKWGNNSKNGYIRAVNTCVLIYNKYGANSFDRTLKVINMIFGINRDALSCEMLNAVSMFLKAYPEADTDTLVKKASKCDPGQMIRSAKNWQANDTQKHKVEFFIARDLVATYNWKMKSNGLDANELDELV